MYVLHEYDNLIDSILTSGKQTTNRTGMDTLSLFGTQCRYDIHTDFPLLTRRKYAYKSIFAELIWMLSRIN